MAQVAREAKVSKNTVSLALRNDSRIPEGTRERIKKIADRLGYQRNAIVGELMAHMRRAKQPTFQATIALINANQDPDAFTDHPTIPVYVEGITRRAHALGYRLDTFWMHDPEVDGANLARILSARGIRGAILVGMMKQNRLPESFFPVVERFPCVVTGVRTRDPALSFACVDHHMLTLRAVEKALELGYRRPALVLDEVLDHLVNGRFTSGYLTGQRRLPVSQHLRPFYQVQECREDPAPFFRWMEEEKPDVIFTLYHVVEQWVKQAGRKVPDDVGLIQLEWRKSRPHWAGMNQHNDVASEAALDMLIGMIHNQESGVPEFPRATLIGSSWVDGKTVKPQMPSAGETKKRLGAKSTPPKSETTAPS
jgi:LacI family transcriptional regulator